MEQDIPGGAIRIAEILHHLQSADVILLLVSADFLASDECQDIVRRALSRAGQVPVIPIILRACVWETSDLGHIQVLPDQGKPITSFRDQSEAWRKVILGIARAAGLAVGPVQSTQTTPSVDVLSTRAAGLAVGPSVPASSSSPQPTTGTAPVPSDAAPALSNLVVPRRLRWLVLLAVAGSLLLCVFMVVRFWSHGRIQESSLPAISMLDGTLDICGGRHELFAKEANRLGMVHIPQRSYRRGGTQAITVPAFFLDKTEVTVAAYQSCVMIGRCSPALEAEWPAMVRPREKEVLSPFCNANDPNRKDHPINCVNRDMARSYCVSADKRLPTDPEWESAALANSGIYPWGNEDPNPTLLNGCGLECVNQPESGARVPLYPTSDGYRTTAPVGTFPRGATGDGVLDMAGNVSEWTCTDRLARGGSWATSSPNELKRCLLVTTPCERQPEAASPDYGFRCAADAAKVE